MQSCVLVPCSHNRKSELTQQRDYVSERDHNHAGDLACGLKSEAGAWSQLVVCRQAEVLLSNFMAGGFFLDRITFY